MNNENTTAIDTPITDRNGSNVATLTPGTRIRLFFTRLMRPLDGMHHCFYAFWLAVMVMALIYTAMETWPLGKSSVLVLDLNGQYVYFFEAIRDIIRGEQGLLYSFERALGGEFLGIIAYYLASPFTLIVALFPEGMITESLYVILLLKCGLSAFNMCVYLHKSHPTTPLAEMIFSLLYALSSYAVVMQHNTMWFDCVLFLPLIFLGVESLIKYGKYKLYVLTLAVAVFSNFYIGYMVCIAVAIYFFFWYAMSTPSERNPLGERFHFPKAFGRIALFSLIAVGMAAAIILPAYYALTFGKTTFSNPNFDFKQKFDFLDLISKMFPASYDTVRPEGWPFVFSGTLTTILLPIFFICDKITPRKKIAYGLLVGIYVFSFNSTTIDLVWHGFQRPNWLNYRYSFVLCFVMVVMAYLVFEHIRELDPKLWLSVGAVLGVLIVILQKLEYENIQDLMTVWFSLAAIAVYMILLSGTRRRWLDGAIETILVVAVLLELFCNGLAETISLDSDVHYSSRASYVNFMNKWKPAADWMNENDPSFYRSEKTEHRKTNDNFALNMKGLSGSTSTLNENQIDFLEQLGYSSRSHWSKYLGGTPVSDSLLGVKYLLTTTEKEMNDVYGEPIHVDEENETAVYLNKFAQSIGYTVNSELSEFDMEDYESPFELMNDLVANMLGEEEYALFKSYKGIKPTYENLELAYVTGHKKYSRTKENYAAKLIFTFTPVNDRELFVYFPSEYRRDAKLKVNGSDISEYFTNETCRIVSLGKRPKGEELIVTLNLDEKDIYLANGVDFFWYLDEELFAEAMERLAEGSYNIESYTDSSFDGIVRATEERSTLMFTFPRDEGWQITVDGKPVESTEILGCVTAIELEPGEHRVQLKYWSWAVDYGVKISLGAIGFFAVILLLDLLMRRRRPRFHVNPAPIEVIAADEYEFADTHADEDVAAEPEPVEPAESESEPEKSEPDNV